MSKVLVSEEIAKLIENEKRYVELNYASEYQNEFEFIRRLYNNSKVLLKEGHTPQSLINVYSEGYKVKYDFKEGDLVKYTSKFGEEVFRYIKDVRGNDVTFTNGKWHFKDELTLVAKKENLEGAN